MSNYGNAYMEAMLALKTFADSSTSLENKADIVAYDAFCKDLQSMLRELKRELQYRERSLDHIDYYCNKK